MPSNFCLVEMHAQSLEWDGGRHALDGKESRDTSVRLAVAKGLSIKTISNEQKKKRK